MADGAHFEDACIGFKTIFQKTFNEIVSDSEQMATIVKSNDLSEKYVWLGNIPQMKEWAGDRAVEQFKDYGYAIENAPFESTVSVDQNHLDYDKIGVYRPAIEQMAQDAKKFGGTLVEQVLIKGTDSVNGKCYDGKAFFAKDHAIGDDTYANLSEQPLNATSVLAAEMLMRSIKGVSGRAMGVTPTHLVIGATNLAKALEIVKKQNLAGGESNVTYERYKIIVCNAITDESWYLLDLSKVVKPLILQKAQDGIFEASNDEKFMKNKALFGCKSFMNAGYGLWQLAYKGDNA